MATDSRRTSENILIIERANESGELWQRIIRSRTVHLCLSAPDTGKHLWRLTILLGDSVIPATGLCTAAMTKRASIGI